MKTGIILCRRKLPPLQHERAIHEGHRRATVIFWTLDSMVAERSKGVSSERPAVRYEFPCSTNRWRRERPLR